MGIMPAKAKDRQLLRVASTLTATSQDLSDAVNNEMSPAQALERVKFLLNSIDIWDEIEERRLLLVAQRNWLAHLEEHKNNEKAWGPINKAYEMVAKQSEKTRVATSDISTHLAKAQAEYYVEGFTRGVETALREFAKRNDIDIEDQEVMELVQVGIEPSTEYLDKVTGKKI